MKVFKSLQEVQQSNQEKEYIHTGREISPMTVYNINRGIGWASSGVEYAQAYRANLFRRAGIPAKFIFTDMFQMENIEHMTKNIGFEDEEVIWLYSYFTDFKISPTIYTTQQLEESFGQSVIKAVREKENIVYDFPGNFYAKAYLKKGEENIVQRVEYVSEGKLIRKDYFTYGKLFSEYYAPKDNRAHLYLRRFFNTDGSEAWVEMIDGDQSTYRIGHQFFDSKARFIAYFIQCLNLTKDDVIIIDRATEIGRAVLQYHGKAKIGSVVHAEHFNENSLSKKDILWNNYYEYEFTNADKIDFFVTATDPQKNLMEQQFREYYDRSPRIVTIPVGSLNMLRVPSKPRKRHSMITASRLASEKHIDWLVMAAAKARASVEDLTLDIYGSGVEEEKLREMIKTLHAESYIRLMGHHQLDEVYQQYEIYAAGSTSEGFGLTLLEAVGSGLAMIGFDVHYGNQTFIDHERNGLLLEYTQGDGIGVCVNRLAEAMIQTCQTEDLAGYSQHSYEIAEHYLTDHLAERWKNFLQNLNGKEVGE